jgi:transcriptional regulator NrdR family protein
MTADYKANIRARLRRFHCPNCEELSTTYEITAADYLRLLRAKNAAATLEGVVTQSRTAVDTAMQASKAKLSDLLIGLLRHVESDFDQATTKIDAALAESNSNIDAVLESIRRQQA